MKWASCLGKSSDQVFPLLLPIPRDESQNAWLMPKWFTFWSYQSSVDLFMYTSIYYSIISFLQTVYTSTWHKKNDSNDVDSMLNKLNVFIQALCCYKCFIKFITLYLESVAIKHFLNQSSVNFSLCHSLKPFDEHLIMSFEHINPFKCLSSLFFMLFLF